MRHRETNNSTFGRGATVLAVEGLDADLPVYGTFVSVASNEHTNSVRFGPMKSQKVQNLHIVQLRIHAGQSHQNALLTYSSW